MTKNPLVSVIMNCYNSSRYLREAIDTVYAQTYKSWEIIFWDNASTDNSAEIAKSYDSKLRYFRGEETVPIGKARNLAIDKARGEYIAFLDCDDLWMPGKLEKQIPLFDAPSVGLVFSDTIFFNEMGKTKQLYGGERKSTGYCFRELIQSYFLSLETVVVRRSALEGLTIWFNPLFNMIEEADLFIRIAHDWKIDMVPEPLGKWRVHSKSLTWQKTELFVVELEEMFRHYSQIYGNFNSEYAYEIKRCLQRSKLSNTVALWQSGKSKEARNYVKNTTLPKHIAYVVTLLTFMPSGMARLIRKIKGDIIP